MPTGVRRLPTNYAALLGSEGNFTVSIGATAGGDLYTFNHRTLTHTFDVVLNDSDKTFVVPAGRLWWIHTLFVRLSTTAVAGNRIILVEVTEPGGMNTFSVRQVIAQVASTTRRYSYGPSLARESAFVSDQIMQPLPTRLLMLPGFAIRIVEEQGIDPTGDTMLIRILHDEITI